MFLVHCCVNLCKNSSSKQPVQLKCSLMALTFSPATCSLCAVDVRGCSLWHAWTVGERSVTRTSTSFWSYLFALDSFRFTENVSWRKKYVFYLLKAMQAWLSWFGSFMVTGGWGSGWGLSQQDRCWLMFASRFGIPSFWRRLFTAAFGWDTTGLKVRRLPVRSEVLY